jgi:CubicO group peptidase (beta-lactamase class C family)
LFGNSRVDELYLEADLLRAPTLAEFTARLGRLPLLFEPGTRWHYSVAVDVQARLVEVISGQRFGDFLRERIFRPLGMQDTFFVVPADKQPRLAQLYSPLGTELSWGEPWQFNDELALTPADPELTRPYFDGSLFESGGAGLVSSAGDYLRFALMLAGGGEWGGVRLLAPRTVEHLRADHSRELDKSGLWGLDTFGLGVGIVTDPAAANGELGAAGAYGWGGAAGTNFWIDPEDDIVGLFMVQSVPHQTPLAKKFRVLTYQALID